RDLRQTYRRLQTLYESTNVVGSTLDLQQVLDHLTESVTKVMSSKACSIRLLDNTGRRLALASTYGLSQEYWQKGVLIVEQNPLVKEALNGKPIAVSDIRLDSRLQYRQEALSEGIRATLTAPLMGRDRALGIIRVYKDQAYSFTENDIAFLTAAANHGSIAIKNAMDYQSVQNLEESKRKFILTVTHELRAPAGVVSSLLHTLIEGYTGEMSAVQKDMLARALRRVEFLQTMIDDLLNLAAYKTGLRLEHKPEPINLGGILNKVIERYRIPAAEKNITLELISECDQPLSVLATADELDRVFNNLISNAIKYTPRYGCVTVSARKVNGTCQIDVADTGIGIPEESLPNLFQEFYRAPNAKAQSKQGTGLGLVTVKDIITRYGGSVQVKSVLNEGTTFTVILPIVELTDQQ
ncbi:MAG: GAF domain-containing sensor histidine kinase, partial [Anaerolineae bacterium]|nr:GAF domain-containing sensor histidine kinase [Anaerolineae bacterium]